MTWITAKWKVHRTGIIMEKSLVKWVPDSNVLARCVLFRLYQISYLECCQFCAIRLVISEYGIPCKVYLGNCAPIFPASAEKPRCGIAYNLFFRYEVYWYMIAWWWKLKRKLRLSSRDWEFLFFHLLAFINSDDHSEFQWHSFHWPYVNYILFPNTYHYFGCVDFFYFSPYQINVSCLIILSNLYLYLCNFLQEKAVDAIICIAFPFQVHGEVTRWRHDADSPFA